MHCCCNNTYRVTLNFRYICMVFEHTRCRKDATVESMMKVTVCAMKIINISAVLFRVVKPFRYLMRRITRCDVMILLADMVMIKYRDEFNGLCTYSCFSHTKRAHSCAPICHLQYLSLHSAHSSITCFEIGGR
jgi:hypothetical protein